MVEERVEVELRKIIHPLLAKQEEDLTGKSLGEILDMEPLFLLTESDYDEMVKKLTKYVKFRADV